MTRQEAMEIREALVRATHVRQRDGFGPNTKADLDFAIGVLKRLDDEALAEDVVPYPRDGSRDGDPWEAERQHRESARPGNVTLGANRPEGGPSNMTVDDYLAMQRGAKPASSSPIADGLANGTYRLAEAMARLEEAVRDGDNDRAGLWARIKAIEAEGKGEPDRPGIDRLARLEEIVNRLDSQAEKAWNAYEPLKAEMARFEGRLTRIGELVDDGIAKLIIAAGERLDTHAKAIGELNDANASLVAQVAALTMKSNEIPPIKDPEARERIEELEHLGSEVRAVLEKRLDRLESGGPLANKSEEALSTAQRLAGLVGQTTLKGTLCERVAELERRMDLDQGPVDLPNPLNLAGEPVAKVDPRDAIGDKQDEKHGSIPVAEALPELRWDEKREGACNNEYAILLEE